MAIFTQTAFKAKIAKLETTLTGLGGKPPVHKHAPFTQNGWKDRITQLEGLIAARRNPSSILPTGMSMETASAIQERVAREKPAGKTPLLAALAAQHLKDTASNPVQRPSPARPASAAPAAAAPIKPAATAPARPAATAPAAVMPSAAAIAREIVAIEDQRKAAALIKTRAEFSALTPAEAMKFIKSGGKITA